MALTLEKLAEAVIKLKKENDEMKQSIAVMQLQLSKIHYEQKLKELELLNTKQ